MLGISAAVNRPEVYIVAKCLSKLDGKPVAAVIRVEDLDVDGATRGGCLRTDCSGYGHDEAITSNCHIQNAFPPNRIETAEHLSKLTGQTTVTKEQITTSGKRIGVMHGHVTRTLQETQRALLTPDECLRLPGPKKDDDGKMNRSLLEVGGEVLAISQFTLYGDCRKGRRPSFVEAAPSEQANMIFEDFVRLLRDTGVNVETGVFGAMMDVSLVNDGPVTLVLER